jgi:hypothetical protein
VDEKSLARRKEKRREKATVEIRSIKSSMALSKAQEMEIGFDGDDLILL